MSVVLLGSTSGSITLQEPAVAGTNTVNFGANTGVAILDANTPAFRNRIINGDMRIDQRNAGASVTGAVGYTFPVDRFKFYSAGASKLSGQRSTTAPTGFVNSLLLTSLAATSPGAGDEYQLYQNIEGFNVADLGWGTANAQTVTLSFWVRSSLTGTFAGCLYNNGGSRSYIFTYTISAANTYEYKTITISGDTSGTWLTTNADGINIIWDLGSGSNLNGTAGSWASAFDTRTSGSVTLVGTNGATFYITGVQLEKGSTATSFDYRSYGTELALCQRYYFALNTENVGSNGSYFVGVNRGTSLQGHISPPQPMRTAPSLTSSGTTTFFVQNGSSNLNCTTAATIGSTTGGNQTIYIVSGTYSSYTVGYAGHMIDQSGASFLNFSAEL